MGRGVTKERINANELSFASTDDLSAFDVSAVERGAIAHVGGETDRFYFYLPSSTGVLSASILATGNSNGVTYPGRWLRIA